MLGVEALEVSLGRSRVLHGIDLNVADGESVALVGANGAGKTTLLRTLSGLLPSQAGRITLGGADITRSSAVDRVRLGLVQLQGGRALWDSMTVRETLTAACFTLPRKEVSARIDEMLERFPILIERVDQRAETLSGGEQQVLALAKALALRPRLLLVDELSLGLAPVVVVRLLETLLELRAAGTTMLLVEQSAATAAVVSNRTITLDKGELVDRA
jgi:branched-chain amino acid transport system ATP-binding protein